jgi:hypothetical protein
MNLKDKELLERVERLLQPKEKVSGLLNFEPINLKTISRIINKTAIVKRKAQGQETDKERHSAGQTDPFNRESLKGNQALSEIDMSFRSEGQGWEIKPVNMTDCLSDLPDGFDLGTNVFISYFLHALEIERLVLVNKDQHSEALEMDKEIECLEETIRQFNQNSDKKLSEVEQIAQLTIQLRESENGKKYIEEQKKESENLLTEELKEIRGKLTRLENKHKNELQNLREDSDPSTKKEIEKMSNQLQQKIKELNDLTEATNKAQEEHRLSLEREREARAALILENEKTMAKLLEKTENEKESMQREQECAIQSLKADYEQTITKLTDELRQAKCDMGPKQELQGAGGLLGEDLGKEGKNEARDGKEQGNEGVGLKGIEGSGDRRRCWGKWGERSGREARGR